MARNWTREEEILAFAFYCRLPFGKLHSSNDTIKALAKMMDRTPASVSMKMCNFARFDPELRARGVAGLTNGSRLDEVIWNEYSSNLEALEEQSRIILSTYGVQEEQEDEVLALPPGETVERTVHARRNQNFFRQAVLLSYDVTCCITGINIPSLLTASHIKPWRVSDSITERTNPQNGLCLNSLHDKAFDRGLITVDQDLRVVISRHLKDVCTDEVFNDYFGRYEGAQIRLPYRFLPSKEFLLYHNEHVFQDV